MKNLLPPLFALLVVFSVSSFAQEKGIDTQTKTIKDARTTDKGNDVSRSFSWDGKTRVRSRLANPYAINSRRDVLINMVLQIFKENKMILDESASRLKDGLLVTEPIVFSKGAIITQTELNRYAEVPQTDQIWTRGRYTLTVDVQSVDGIRNNVYVTAKVEGRSENGIFSEWSNLESSGVAEEEFLSKLVTMTGKDLDSEGRRP
jgi:hypothetical protein